MVAPSIQMVSVFFHPGRYFAVHPREDVFVIHNLQREQCQAQEKRQQLIRTGPSRRCNFAPWDKGQCPHGALLHAVPGCCKCFQQCRVAPKCPNSRSPSYPTLFEALATPWDSVEQCPMGTLSLVPRSKVASSGRTFKKLKHGLEWGLQEFRVSENVWEKIQNKISIEFF